jgi:hypothetical protein
MTLTDFNNHYSYKFDLFGRDSLSGTTGTNSRVTVSADSVSGNIYVEARRGTSRFTILIQSTVYEV